MEVSSGLFNLVANLGQVAIQGVLMFFESFRNLRNAFNKRALLELRQVAAMLSSKLLGIGINVFVSCFG